ncbi:MAG TPA: patatin-like phospholipase family protein [Steroidobacteraceae bacterium]|nr:patatin-like phospholipase family protein [Steroidobacteraceae bacterium]
MRPGGLGLHIATTGCWLALALAGGLAAADEQPASAAESQPRPRIGLVLSGGGARGGAHIGVLKVLEQEHVPIDAIAGTSMGAIVGGLYAAGLTPKEIEEKLVSIDWQDAFRDRPPRRELTFRRKQDDNSFLVRFPLGVRGGEFRLPKGLIQGQKLTRMLREYTAPVATVSNFDQLPIPFRAVATDLETGEARIFASGDLVTAMRASMSAPGVFAPVEIDGRLLVDGGLAENLPIDVMRTMNVDVLIVVDVSFPLLKEKDLTSALVISNQAVAIMIQKDTARQKATLGASDVVIDPPLGDASSVDFVGLKKMIAAGEIGALKMTDRLAALGIGEEQYQHYLAQRDGREPPAPRIDFVTADAKSKRYASLIDATMGPLKGTNYDAAEAGKRIANLYGLDLFESIDYSLASRDNLTGLDVMARRKSWGPNYVRFGLNLQDDFEGNSAYNAAVRVIMTELNTRGGELLIDGQIGSNPRFAAELYQPLDAARRYFISPHADFDVRKLQLRDAQNDIAEYRLRESIYGLDVGRELGNWGEFRVGYARSTGSAHVRIGDPTIPGVEFNTGQYFARFSVDTIDDLNFPHRGQLTGFGWLGARHDVDSGRANQLVADWLWANTFGRNTWILWTSAGATVDGTAQVEDFFSLGGLFNLSGLPVNSVNGANVGIARVLYYRKIGKGGQGFLNVPAYLGASIEAGNVWDDRSSASLGSSLKDASLFLGLDTFLGPVYLAAGYDSGGQTAFYLFLGRTF